MARAAAPVRSPGRSFIPASLFCEPLVRAFWASWSVRRPAEGQCLRSTIPLEFANRNQRATPGCSPRRGQTPHAPALLSLLATVGAGRTLIGQEYTSIRRRWASRCRTEGMFTASSVLMCPPKRASCGVFFPPRQACPLGTTASRENAHKGRGYGIHLHGKSTAGLDRNFGRRRTVRTCSLASRPIHSFLSLIRRQAEKCMRRIP